jgi:hypothetical protein
VKVGAGKIVWLSPLQPLPTPDQRGMIPYRTNVILIQNSGWRLCIMDAVTSALGARYLSAAILKRIKAARLGGLGIGDQDLTIYDVLNGIAQLKLPFEFQRRKKLTLPNLTENPLTEGIYLCLFSFLHPDTKITDKHHVVIDCNRKIILDNSESNPISFVGLTAKQVRSAISCCQLDRVWQVMVNCKRRGETKYI